MPIVIRSAKILQPKRSKYGNIRTEYNGRMYASKKEAHYAARLDLLIKCGEIKYYLQQVPLVYPGGGKLVIDFIIFYANHGVEYVDVKGTITAMYKAKKRIVEAIYPIKIKEV